MTKKIGILVGSLRQGSFTRKIAQELIRFAPSSLDLKIIEIGELPLYNQDLDQENNLPPTWAAFRRDIASMDGFIFATPEYNRSVPAALKNALDVASRPYGKSAWEGKPGAVISVTPGAIGGFGANQHIRQSLVFLNVPCMQQPEAYLGNVTNLLNEEGHVKNDTTKEFLKKFMDDFSNWVETNAKQLVH